ncbi:MAG: ATP-binding protein [Bacteroidales bacterium]|nr:ATP-binding protein [Bacteroidales bacterium]MDD4385792.1 ATP-binding protein [Bacteroidales bacterium]
MNKKQKNKQGKIKPKVLFGYLIILSITLAALAVTYKGFIDLTKTRQSISEPSQKLIKLNSIITDIYEAESNIRTYTLTQNESYLSIYLGFMKNINTKVDSLLTLADNNPVQSEKIRFIQELLNRKRRVLRELIALKKTDQSSRFYAKALEEVENINLDGVKESAVITSVTTTTKSRRDSIINVDNEASTQGVFSKLLRWFSKKEPTDSTITKLIVEVETQIDTLRKSMMSPSDSLMNEVVRILAEIQDQQEMAMYNIGEKELELLKSDKEIMDQIRTVLSLLEREELMNSYNMAEEVKKTVKESTYMLLGLGSFALIMSILFIWTIFRDLSRANYYRNQLFEAKQYAEKLLHVKEEFLANMNHEIRTPLTAIIGLSKKLSNSQLDEEQKHEVELMNSSSQHLLQIVNDILDLSKIEGEYLKFEKVAFIPEKIIAEAFNTLRVKAHEKGLNYSMNANNLAKTSIVGDPLRLKQIMYNLLSNAIKFTHMGGVNLSLNAEMQDEHNLDIEVIVSDTGIGIPKDMLDTIFEQFSQIDSSTSRLFGGTGLGLTIVKKLIELQKGTITVTSKIDEGSTFSIKISYPIATEEHIKSLETLHKPTLPSNIDILVAEDDPIGQLLIREMLKTLGVSPTIVGDPNEALRLAKTNSYAIVITDIQMPGLSGFDLSKAIQGSIPNPPPTLAITANSNIEQQSEYAEAGFAAYLVKPFDEIELYNAIATLIGEEKLIDSTPRVSSLQGDYDISDILRFANDDDESTCIILQSFIDNSELNLKNLKNSVEKADWKEVSELAHKMKSAFRQLKVFTIALEVEGLENLDINTTAQSLEKSLAAIEQEVKRVNTLITSDINRLKTR